MPPASDIRFYETPYMFQIGHAVTVIELTHDDQGPLLSYFVIVTDKAETWLHEKLRVSSELPFDDVIPTFLSWAREAARSNIQVAVADPLNRMAQDPHFMINVSLLETDKQVLARLFSFPQCRSRLELLKNGLVDEATKTYIRFLASIRVEIVP